MVNSASARRLREQAWFDTGGRGGDRRAPYEDSGFEVELRRAADVGDLTPYDGVVLGGALYFGCWHP